MVDYRAGWDLAILLDLGRVESTMWQAQLYEYAYALEAEGAILAAPQTNEIDKNKRGHGRRRGFA
eukprot:9132982-Pyramimonas_sp.AAC.1